MYSKNAAHNTFYQRTDKQFVMSQTKEYSRSTPHYNVPYNEQVDVRSALQHQEHDIHYHHMTQYKNEELQLQNTILRNIMAYKKTGQINDAWAVITYIETNKPLIDIYVTGKYYVIDNSDYIQDQFRIGLGSLQSYQFKENLQVVLSQNEDGSISLTNNSTLPVFIKDYLDMEQPFFSQEVIEQQGIITRQEEPIKIFDIEEFQSEMALQIYHNQYNREQLMLFCKTNVLFTEAQHCMESPSWIMVTNLQAMDSVFDNQVYSTLEENIANYIAAGTLRKMRNRRKKTFRERTNTNSTKFGTQRKTRMSLVMKGHKIKEFMKYSWESEEVSTEDAVNMKEMEEFFEPDKDYMFDIETEDASPNYAKLVGKKMWAKVKYVLENMNNENI